MITRDPFPSSSRNSPFVDAMQIFTASACSHKLSPRFQSSLPFLHPTSSENLQSSPSLSIPSHRRHLDRSSSVRITIARSPRLLPCRGYARIYPMPSSSLLSCLSVASISSILSSSACRLDQRFLSSQPNCFISCRSRQTVLHPNCGLFFRISFLSSLSSSPSASAMPRQTPLSSMQPNPSLPSSVLLQLSMPHQALSQLPNVVRYPLPTPHNIDLRPPVFYPLSLSPECLPAAS